MALWLRETREQHRSLSALVARLRGLPDEALPLFQLTHQAEAAAKNRLKGQVSVFQALNGQRAQFTERGSRDAVRDVATLWYLFVEVNARFLAEKRALWLQLAYLASSYARWISDINRGAEALAERLTAALVETYGWTEALDQLMERYFREECSGTPSRWSSGSTTGSNSRLSSPRTRSSRRRYRSRSIWMRRSVRLNRRQTSWFAPWSTWLGLRRVT